MKIFELRGNWNDNKSFHKLSSKLKKVVDDSILQAAISRIQPKIEVFDMLRSAIRIAGVSGKKELNGDDMDDDMRDNQRKSDWISPFDS